MKLSHRQKQIILGMLRDRERLAALTPRYSHGDRALAAEREDIFNAREGLVRGNPGAWLRTAMTQSQYAMTSRNYQQLWAKGLIVRHAYGLSPDRTAHLSLTPEGERIARELLAAEATDG